MITGKLETKARFYVQFGLRNGQDRKAVLAGVQKMETVEQLEPYTCVWVD